MRVRWLFLGLLGAMAVAACAAKQPCVCSFGCDAAGVCLVPQNGGGGAGGGTGAGGGSGNCSATTCSGCCSNGACLLGTETISCGRAGAACQNCQLQHSACVSQGCVIAPDGGGAGGGTGGDGGTTDAGPSSYADGGSRYRFWDGGACAVETDCPCFSSDDCGPGFCCHSKDATGANVFCVPGARGAGLAGDTCAGEADCVSALCTDSTTTGMRCSALCDVAAECPATLPRCTHIGFGVDRSICAP